MYTYKLTIHEYDDYEDYGNHVRYFASENKYSKEQFKSICEEILKKDKYKLYSLSVCDELEKLGFKKLICNTEISINDDLCKD